MSDPKTGPKVGPEIPKTFGNPMSAVELSTYEYTSWISNALRRLYGGCAKAVARASGSNVESAKNWLDERNAMSGRVLLHLMAADDQFCAEMLERIGRADEAKKVRLKALIGQVEQLLGGSE